MILDWRKDDYKVCSVNNTMFANVGELFVCHILKDGFVCVCVCVCVLI